VAAGRPYVAVGVATAAGETRRWQSMGPRGARQASTAGAVQLAGARGDDSGRAWLDRVASEPSTPFKSAERWRYVQARSYSRVGGCAERAGISRQGQRT
jgi:hypothetical protein